MKDHKKLLDKLAREVTKKMTINNFLHKKFEIYNHFNDLLKEIIAKVLEKEIPILSSFSQYSKQIEKEYNNLKDNYNNIYTKFNSLLEECGSEISMGKPVLSQKKNEEFTLQYLKNEKDDTIDWIKKSIKSSKKYHLFREPKRDNLVDITKGNIKMEKIINDFQHDMLYVCKRCNKYNYKINQYGLKIGRIQNNIKILNKYIETNKFKVSDFKKFSKESFQSKTIGKLMPITKNKTLVYSERVTKKGVNNNLNKEYQNNSDIDIENKAHIEKKNIILDFIKVENLFDISNEEGEKENMIDYELHSDDDTVFENKLKIPNQLSTTYIKEIKKIVPSFNFKQIEFNKNKVNEIDVYSIQRRQFKNKNMDEKIIEMRKKIDSIINKIEIIKHKEKIMKEFVKKLEENYETMQKLIHQTTQINFVENDLFDTLNSEKEKKENDEINEFLDNIEEVEEEKEYNENFQNEKSNNDKKIEKIKKEEEEEKKMEEKILKSILNKNILKEKKIGLKKTFKTKRNLLVSLPIKFLKKNVEKKKGRARSK